MWNSEWVVEESEQLERLREKYKSAERCELCKWYHTLKFNYVMGKGFKESHCCDVLLHTGEKGGWVQETEPNDMCELFKQEGRMKFKVGDKVRIRVTPKSKAIGVVDSADEDLDYLQYHVVFDNGWGISTSEDKIELIERASNVMKFKEGDRVRYKNKSNTYGEIMRVDLQDRLYSVKWSGAISPVLVDEDEIELVDDEFERYRKQLEDGLINLFDMAYKGGYNKGIAEGNINDGSFAEKVNEAYQNGYNKGYEDGQKCTKGKECDSILIGDVCKYKINSGVSRADNFIVTKIDDGFFDAIYQDGTALYSGTLELIEKTGKHYDGITELLEKLRGETD